MIVREATIEDLNEIYDFVKVVGRLHAEARVDVLKANAITLTKDKLVSRITSDKYTVYVACMNDNLVGVVMFYIKEITDDIKYRDCRVLKVEEIVVDSQYKGMGVAHNLMNEVKKFAHNYNCNRIESNVWQFNEQSKKFFFKEGFRRQQQIMELSLDADDRKKVVEWYDDIKKEEKRIKTTYKKIEIDNTFRHILEEIQNSSAILDCAAGIGTYAIMLAQKGYHVTASDISRNSITYLIDSVNKLNLSMACHVDDALDLKRHDDDCFDCVLCMGPAYHLGRDDLKKCLIECARVTKPGGKIIVSYMNKNYWGPYILKHKPSEYSIEALLRMMEKGTFDVDNSSFISKAYYYSPIEIEKLINKENIGKISGHYTIDSNWVIAHESLSNMSSKDIDSLKNYIYQNSAQKEQLCLGKNNMVVIKKAKEISRCVTNVKI